jgi:hypothetical protein
MKKGALVELVSAMGASLPNVVIFQFNPETVRHAVTQPATASSAGSGAAGGNPMAVSGPPNETYSFTLAMDIADQLTDASPVVREAAQAHGLHARLAALELLLHPSAIVDPLAGGTGGGRATPAATVPTVLFVWGKGRIVPVRVTTLNVTEKLFDEELNPTHAEAQIELKVLTPDELRAAGAMGALATAAYHYTQGLRVARAAVNLGAADRTLIGIVQAALTP